MSTLPWFKRFLARLCGLSRDIRETQATVEERSRDRPFGMRSRNGFLRMCGVMARGTRAVDELTEQVRMAKIREGVGR